MTMKEREKPDVITRDVIDHEAVARCAERGVEWNDLGHDERAALVTEVEAEWGTPDTAGTPVAWFEKQEKTRQVEDEERAADARSARAEKLAG